MNCREASGLLVAHADGELGLPHAAELEAHLEACAVCRGALAGVTELRASVRSHATYHVLPSGLETRIRAALPRGEPSAAATVVASSITAPAASRRDWAWPQIGAGFAMAFALAWSVGLYLVLPGPSERLQEELVASHTRALMANHALDVASSSRHTVKPWFNGKLDFSPAVFDLAAQGYVLTGGRLDYLDHRPVAALVYQHNTHPINLFVWPASGRDDAPRSVSRRGYNLVHWTRGGLNYWAVSDLNTGELTQFRDMLLQVAD